MSNVIQITSNNFNGQYADITFYPCSGGSINLGYQLLPYDYAQDNYEGTYDIYVSAYTLTCQLVIACPSPTPTNTPTMTVTPTVTVTPTMTVTPTNTVTPTPTVSPGPAFDADAAAYLAAVISAGGTTDSTISAATDTLFTSLKSNGLYNKIKRLYPFVGGVANSNKINAKIPGTNDIGFNGGWTHNYSGSTPNGTTGYGNLGIFGSGGENLVGSNYHHSIYIGAPKTSGNFEYDIAAELGFPTNELLSESTDYRYTKVARTDSGQAYQSPPSAYTGFFANSSSDPDFTLQIRTIQTPRSQAITLALPSGNTYLGARNNNGVAELFATKQYSFLTIGERLTNTELSNLENAINTFQTALGRNTY